MWEWKRLINDTASRTQTFVMTVPGGYIVRTRTPAQIGRGANYAEHPLTVSEAMVFVPHTGLLDAPTEKTLP